MPDGYYDADDEQQRDDGFDDIIECVVILHDGRAVHAHIVQEIRVVELDGFSQHVVNQGIRPGS